MQVLQNNNVLLFLIFLKKVSLLIVIDIWILIKYNILGGVQDQIPDNLILVGELIICYLIKNKWYNKRVLKVTSWEVIIVLYNAKLKYNENTIKIILNMFKLIDIFMRILLNISFNNN